MSVIGSILLVVIFVVLVVTVFAGNYLVNFAIGENEQADMVAPPETLEEKYQQQYKENQAKLQEQRKKWLDICKIETVRVTADDQAVLVGNTYIVDENSHKWVLGIHGYSGNRDGMEEPVSRFGLAQYNALIMDLRAHGESGGKFKGMGWLDRKDLCRWVDKIISIDPEAEIIIYGISMGGAAAMMVSGEKLPANVKGIVEDCGYSDVWNMFKYEVKYIFKIPAFPILHMASFISSIRAGYNFREASAIAQVAKCEKPMLFIHGPKDILVNPNMMPLAYDACPAPKAKLMIEGAGHANSYILDTELYYNTVFQFIEQKCS